MAKATTSAQNDIQLAVGGTQISVSADFTKAVLNGVTVETVDGRLVITTPDGKVISKPAAANDTAIAAGKAALEAGDRIADGTIYAGEVAGKAVYAAPTDARVRMSFYEAAKYAKKLNKERYLGHDDWRVPTREELNVLFQNRKKGALKGTFNLTGSDSDVLYWSSTSINFTGAWCQRLSDGGQYNGYRYDELSVRCVR